MCKFSYPRIKHEVVLSHLLFLQPLYLVGESENITFKEVIVLTVSLFKGYTFKGLLSGGGEKPARPLEYYQFLISNIQMSCDITHTFSCLF